MINFKFITELTGLLGFIISVFTFILTRYERRKKIEIELSSSSGHDFKNLDDDYINESDSFIKVKFVNLSQRTIILKPRTLKIKIGKNKFHLSNNDFIGMNSFEELMPPSSIREIGIFFDDDLKNNLGIKTSKHYTESKTYSFKVYINDHLGKVYSNKRYKYFEATGEFF